MGRARSAVRRRVFFTCASLLAAVPAAACAQQAEQSGARVRRSQHGSVTQRVGSTEIAVTYNRPVARGRTLFGAGGVVRWGRIWNPGADTATAVSFSSDVLVNGERLAAGTYSLWMIPAEGEPWTVILSRAQPVWHTPYPEGQDALRLRATPTTAAHMEALAFYFPVVEPDSTVLQMHWGTVVVALRITPITGR